MSDPAIESIIQTLGCHSVIRFPRQTLGAGDLKNVSARLGELKINVVATFQEPSHPEAMILSNIVEYGRPIVLGDAGQSWHADLSFSEVIAFANVLYALRVSQRDVEPPVATEFSKGANAGASI